MTKVAHSSAYTMAKVGFCFCSHLFIAGIHPFFHWRVPVAIMVSCKGSTANDQAALRVGGTECSAAIMYMLSKMTRPDNKSRNKTRMRVSDGQDLPSRWGLHHHDVSHLLCQGTHCRDRVCPFSLGIPRPHVAQRAP